MASAPLTVLTWNIGRLHLGRHVNRVFRFDSRAHDKALRHVARVIDESEAHVVVLQELASRSQLAQILELLGPNWDGGMGPDAGGDRAVALLMQRRYAGVTLSHETVALEGGRNAEVCRGDGWITIGLHFDAFRAKVRHRQAQDLAAFVDSLAEDTVIVAGDLNIDMRYPLHSRASDKAFLRAMARTFTDLGLKKGPTAAGRRRLDYILVRGAASAEARVMRRRRVPLGDHDPLLARIVLPVATAQEARQAQ